MGTNAAYAIRIPLFNRAEIAGVMLFSNSYSYFHSYLWNILTHRIFYHNLTVFTKLLSYEQANYAPNACGKRLMYLPLFFFNHHYNINLKQFGFVPTTKIKSILNIPGVNFKLFRFLE